MCLAIRGFFPSSSCSLFKIGSSILKPVLPATTADPAMLMAAPPTGIAINRRFSFAASVPDVKHARRAVSANRLPRSCSGPRRGQQAPRRASQRFLAVHGVFPVKGPVGAAFRCSGLKKQKAPFLHHFGREKRRSSSNALAQKHTKTDRCPETSRNRRINQRLTFHCPKVIGRPQGRVASEYGRSPDLYENRNSAVSAKRLLRAVPQWLERDSLFCRGSCGDPP